MSRRHFHARVVLLDWDGTLLNSYAADVRAYLAMFRALKIEWGIPELERRYSPDWYQVYRAAKVPRARWAEADRLWRKTYLAERPALLPGARAALRALKQRFVLGLVTSGSGGRVRPQLRRFGLTDYFSVCVCSEDTPRKKPHPAPLQRAIKHLGARPRGVRVCGRRPAGRRNGAADRRARDRSARPLPHGRGPARRTPGPASHVCSRRASIPAGAGIGIGYEYMLREKRRKRRAAPDISFVGAKAPTP